MADIKRKLSQLTNAGPGSAPGGALPPPRPAAAPPAEAPAVQGEDRAARLARLRQLMEQVKSRPRPASPRPDRSRPARLLPGQTRETPAGPVHVAEEYLPPDHCQGRVPVAPAREVSGPTLAELALDAGVAGAQAQGMLVLDTETTGLVGGTGTVPFLVGIARFVDESLCVEQLFLRDLGQEAPLLALLAERLRQASLLVTYNGKTFDWPLLRTRFIMNRVPLPELPPHLDLLHCARRVYKRRLGDLRLVSLETHILGLVRQDDVPGAEIPARYWDYLRSRREDRLVPVLEHNLHDLASLAALVGRMCLHYEQVDASDEAEDQLGYARVAERAGNLARARAFALAVALGSGQDQLAAEAWLMVAHQARRRGDVEEQERALLRALPLARGGQLAAVHLALAKLCEHRLKDLPRARVHAERAGGAEPEEQNRRRLDRLARRRPGGASRCPPRHGRGGAEEHP